MVRSAPTTRPASGARVELDEFRPEHEMTARQLIAPQQFHTTLFWGAEVTAGLILERGLAIENGRLGTGDEIVELDDGARLRAVTEGDARPVVFCHGGPGGRDTLAPAARLAANVARVHRYDQRACGRSSGGPPFTMARWVADLEALTPLGAPPLGRPPATRSAPPWCWRTRRLVVLDRVARDPATPLARLSGRAVAATAQRVTARARDECHDEVTTFGTTAPRRVVLRSMSKRP
jgi:hypothetical protein